MQNNSNFPNNDYNTPIKDFNQQGQNSNKSGKRSTYNKYYKTVSNKNNSNNSDEKTNINNNNDHLQNYRHNNRYPRNNYQDIKYKNKIINSRTSLNYKTSMKKSTFLNYNNNPTFNNINKIVNKLDLVNIPKIEEESQFAKINTVLNPINSLYSQSANNSIYVNNNSNKNSDLKMLSSLTRWINGYNGILKGYNTTNNTANNSIIESMEIINKNDTNNKKRLTKRHLSYSSFQRKRTLD